METLKEQITLHPSAAGLFIGIAIILLAVTILAGIQAFIEWKEDHEN